MENKQEILEYCGKKNRENKQYQESVQEVIFGTEKSAENICDDLGIDFFPGE